MMGRDGLAGWMGAKLAPLAMVAAGAALAPEARALELSDFHIDANGSWGYSKPTVTSGSEAPTLMLWSLGATGGYRMGDFFAGLTSDFRYAGQYSEVVTGVGNVRGIRWNVVSPTVGYRPFEKALLKADLQFLGSHKLLTDGQGGASVSYTKPFGGRVVALYEMMDRIHGGVHFETVTFSGQSSSITGDTTLAKGFTLWQLGLTAAYFF